MKLKLNITATKSLLEKVEEYHYNKYIFNLKIACKAHNSLVGNKYKRGYINLCLEYKGLISKYRKAYKKHYEMYEGVKNARKLLQ